MNVKQNILYQGIFYACHNIFNYLILCSMDFILDFFKDNFANCIWLAVILVAMCPTLESKISIPLAMNTAIWGTNALSPLSAFALSFIGSIVPCYLIMFLVRKIKKKTTCFVVDKLFSRYSSKSQNIDGKSSNFKKYLALTAFVAVPIPLTGVWTGSLIAGLTNLNLHYCFIAITLGALISSGAITLLCTVFENSISYIFMVSLIIIVVFMITDLILSTIKHNKSAFTKSTKSKDD